MIASETTFYRRPNDVDVSISVSQYGETRNDKRFKLEKLKCVAQMCFSTFS